MTMKPVDDSNGKLMTVEEFKNNCESGCLIDYDGMGDLVKDGEIVTPTEDGWPRWIVPSKRDEIPEDVTHVLWYNR